jgi:hypothetical protein
MEGSLENFIREQGNPDPVEVAVNHARLDIIAGLDRARSSLVTQLDPIYQFRRSDGPNITPRGVTTHIDAEKVPRVPFTKERRIGDSVYHDQVLARDRVIGDGDGPGGHYGKSAAATPFHKYVHIDTDFAKFRNQTTKGDLEKLSDVRRKQLGEGIEMFDKLVKTQMNFTEAVGGNFQRPVERILGPTVSRGSQTLIPVGTNETTQTPILASRTGGTQTTSSTVNRRTWSSQTDDPAVPYVQGGLSHAMDIDANLASRGSAGRGESGELLVPTVQGTLSQTFARGGVATLHRHSQLGRANIHFPPAGPSRPPGSRRGSLPNYVADDDDPVAFVDRLNPPPVYEFGRRNSRGAPPAYGGPVLPRTGGPLLGPAPPRLGLAHNSVHLSRMGGRVLVDAPPQPPRWTGDMARPDPNDMFPDIGWFNQGLDDVPRRGPKRKKNRRDEGTQGRDKFRKHER